MNTLELAYFAIDENVPFSAIVFMRVFISSHAFQTVGMQFVSHDLDQTIIHCVH